MRTCSLVPPNLRHDQTSRLLRFLFLMLSAFSKRAHNWLHCFSINLPMSDFIFHLMDSYSLILFYHLFLLFFFSLKFSSLLSPYFIFIYALPPLKGMFSMRREFQTFHCLVFAFDNAHNGLGYLMLVDCVNCRFNLQMFNLQKRPNVL